MSNEVTINTRNMLTNGETARALMGFAESMASGRVTVPAHLQGSVADCLAITMQSAQWGMNPFAVAQKTHLVNGVLGYEAQLINAVIKTSGAIHGRFHYEYIGAWENLVIRQEKYQANGKDKWRTVYQNDKGLGIRVGAVIAGEDEIQWGQVLLLENIKIKNSPEWGTDPKQQIAYLGTKKWARLYCPEVILGAYSTDELKGSEEYTQQERDITPKKEAESIDDFLEQADPVEALEESRETYTALLAEFDGAKTLEELSAAIQGSAKAGDQLNDEQKADLSKAAKTAKQRIQSQSQTVEFD